MKEKEIVVVEDDRDIRELIAIILAKESYTIKLCASATAFRHHMAEEKPDIIVLDVMLPDGNGIDLCRELKENPLTENIPVVLMSANRYENIQQAGADTFITKPFNIEQLKGKIEYFLLSN